MIVLRERDNQRARVGICVASIIMLRRDVIPVCVVVRRNNRLTYVVARSIGRVVPTLHAACIGESAWEWDSSRRLWSAVLLATR